MIQRLHLPAEADGSVWRYANVAAANKRHRHAELELNLITRGQGAYLLGQRRYQIRRGDLLWLFPEQEHVLIEQSSDFEMWIAVFRRRLIKRSAIDAAAQPLLRERLQGEAGRRLKQDEVARLESLLGQLSQATAETGLLNAGLGYALLECWRCFGTAGDVPVDEIHPAVERAAQLIRDNGEAGSLPDIARRAGLSAGRLSRLFKQQTGFTLVDFRNRKRVERFLEIYGSGQRKTMLAAALDAGFGSYPQFHRMFTRVMGCSPGAYRSRCELHDARRS